MNAIRSLYLHVPFCERKCEYCDFTSIAGRRDEHAYMRALAGEIRMLAERVPHVTLDTVFIGGGTPSFVDPELIAGVMRSVRDGFALAPGAEITMEANPSSTTMERARRWRDAGITRVSIGVQSLDAQVLRFLGRVHDSEQALAAVDAVQRAGIGEVSCDLIYAVPGLDDGTWRTTLRSVIATGVRHVSCYELTVEEGTPLHRSVRLGRVGPVGGDAALRQHRMARDELAAAGLEQYEVSNFAAPGHESRHNLTYWRNGYYLAAGVGAHGHLPAALGPALGLTPPPEAVALRHWHGRGIAAYVAAVEDGRLPVAGSEWVDAPARETERLMLGLRLLEGVRIDDPALAAPLASLRGAGLLAERAGRVHVTERGEDVLNAVAAELAAAVA